MNALKNLAVTEANVQTLLGVTHVLVQQDGRDNTVMWVGAEL